MNLVDRLHTTGIVPVTAVSSSDEALRICEALLAGGLPVIEVTFRTSAAANAIQTAVSRFPEMLVGAGTILSREDVNAARDAGAAFAVAPGLNSKVVEEAHKIALPFFPGVSTPSEIEGALQLGCTIQKLFPVEALGGMSYLKAISAPYVHTGIRFMPTGGVNLRNLADYLEFPSVIAVGGTWIAPPDLITNGAWPTIGELVREAVALVQSIRDPRVQA